MAEEKKKCNDEPLLNIDNEIIPSQAKKLKCYANENMENVKPLNPYFLKEENFPDLVFLFNHAPQYLDSRVFLFVVQNAGKSGYEMVVEEKNKIKFRKNSFENPSMTLSPSETTNQTNEHLAGIKKLIKKTEDKFREI